MAAMDSTRAEEGASPVLPAVAAVYEWQLVLADFIEVSLMPQLHPGRFIAAPSVVTTMGAALGVNYTAKMSTRLWKHFNERRGAGPVPPTHTYVSALKVLYLHEDVARLFAQWLEAQGSKKRTETERQSKKRAPPVTTTARALPLQEVDTNAAAPVKQPAAKRASRNSSTLTVASDQLDQECAKALAALTRRKDQERSQALADLKFQISELAKQGTFLLHFTKTEFLPVEDTVKDITKILFAFEPSVIALALKEVDEYLTKFCPEAVSKIDWKTLCSERPAVPLPLPDVAIIFEPLPNPVSLICK